MKAQLIYLDHNATTPIRPESLAAMTSVLAEGGNPSSVHHFGRMARKHVESARKKIADTLDVSSGQVFFNSGATEGNNTILKGFAGQRILVSAIEHSSVLECGVDAQKIPVTSDGVVDLDVLHMLIAEQRPALVSVMLVNNETGVIQPVSDIARMAKAAGALVHCDAVQAYGRIPFTRESLGVDFITLSAHKIGGAQGAGAIVVAPNTPLPTLLHGGGQERRSRAGTENVPAIVAFGMAAECALRDLALFQNLSVLRDRIETVLTASSHISLYGQHAPRVSNTISCTIDGVASDTLLMAFDIEGIAISSGSACSSGTVRFSHVLTAMGAPHDKTTAALRISLGYTTTEKEVEQFITVWNNLCTRLLKD